LKEIQTHAQLELIPGPLHSAASL